MSTPDLKPDHALVIGGSMAGLLAARVLAGHFCRVTVIERDRFPLQPGPRKGASQARHAHLLLCRGQQVLEQLFPGITAELTGAGVPEVDAARDVAWLSPQGWTCRFPSRVKVLSSSRDLLEWSVRRRVAALPGVRFLEETEVLGLLGNPAGVTGVTLRRRNAISGETPLQRQEAQLIVDASGRNSDVVSWLTSLGYPAAPEEVVRASLGYASRLYRPPPGLQVDWKVFYLQSRPPALTRGGLLQGIEDGRWLLTLAGRSGDFPPTSEDGFLEFARSLRHPDLAALVEAAEPLSPISGYRYEESRLRHFERLRRWPGNFVVLGDAACSFNPVYGQGMTTAALGALALEQSLRSPGASPRDRAKGFQARLARVNSVPWMLSSGEDLRYPDTAGQGPGWLRRLQHAYVDQVIRLGTHRPHVHRRFLEVLHLLTPPRALFGLGVVLPMLAQALGFIGKRTEGSGRVAPSTPVMSSTAELS